MKLTPAVSKLADERRATVVSLLGDLEVPESLTGEIAAVAALSDFFFESAKFDPEGLRYIIRNGLYDRPVRTDEYDRRLKEVLEASDEESFNKALRVFRRRQMMTVAWRELSGRSDMEENFRELSAIAEKTIVSARDWLYRKLCAELGTPKDKDGNPQPMLVMGMGKLGGHELNFSSDVDLIFCFPHNGTAEGPRREITNQAFFIRLGQALIASLQNLTADGMVFRVDMRLRPFGETGYLAVSFAAMEDYYEKHGRSWERYAMVKARVLGPHDKYATELEEMLRPFIYRVYLDYGAIDSLRKMKTMIEAEVRRRGLKNNIKLGAGGIREVEFLTQVFQLMRGGREKDLVHHHLPDALKALGNLGFIPQKTVSKLLESYLFLRHVENILQEIADRQTQTLPDNELDNERLLSALGLDLDGFIARLQESMDCIHSEFKEIVRDPDSDDDEVRELWGDVWGTNLKDTEIAPMIAEFPRMTEESAEALAKEITEFREEAGRRAIGPVGRETLNQLMPKIFDRVVTYDNPVELFVRMKTFIKKIMTRTTYLQLLLERSDVLDQMMRLSSASENVVNQFCEHPILLDELMIPESLYQLMPLNDIAPALREFLMRVPTDDTEQQMNAMREFKQIQLLRISSCDIADALPLMKVSDYLTAVAEAIISEVTVIAWNMVTARHGMPRRARETGERGFAVIAYGKLGGIELGYTSDLDLVFLHEEHEGDDMTDGEKPVSVRQFYAKVAQKILMLFNTRMSSGVLYDIDTRLRPDGEAGLLVSTFNAFELYQKNSAWTWEHQALVRARPVFGEDHLRDEFSRIRTEVLTASRDPEKLRDDVVSMREKMRASLIRGGKGQVDLKQSPGCMTDIEFIAQYLVLRYAHEHPEMAAWSDNIRIFDSAVACGILAREDASDLKSAYISIRNEAHRQSLRGLARIVPDSVLVSERAKVTELWQKILG